MTSTSPDVLAERLKHMKEAIEHISGKVDGIDTKVNDIDTKVSVIETELSAIKAGRVDFVKIFRFLGTTRGVVLIICVAGMAMFGYQWPLDALKIIKGG